MSYQPIIRLIVLVLDIFDMLNKRVIYRVKEFFYINLLRRDIIRIAGLPRTR